jgi:hypothetical protein
MSSRTPGCKKMLIVEKDDVRSYLYSISHESYSETNGMLNGRGEMESMSWAARHHGRIISFFPNRT